MSHAATALRWGIVGPGGIARDFAASLARHEAGRVVGVCSRSAERASAFTAEYGGRPTADLEDLLRTPGLDAVYVATPHAFHRVVAERLLQEGVPVLCEKPMCTAAADTRWLIGLAGMTATPLLEGWMYRTHPQWSRLMDLVGGGGLGRVRRIIARFGFLANQNPGSRLFDPAAGGGAILDIGGYPVSAALGVAAASTGRTVDQLEPAIAGGGSLTATGVDADAIASIEFTGDIRAAVATSITRDLGMHLEVQGEEATAILPTPFLPGGRRDGTRATVLIRDAAGREHAETLEATVDCYAAEALAMGELVRGGLHASPPTAMVDHAGSIAIASLLEAWRGLLPGGGDAATTGVAPSPVVLPEPPA